MDPGGAYSWPGPGSRGGTGLVQLQKPGRQLRLEPAHVTLDGCRRHWKQRPSFPSLPEAHQVGFPAQVATQNALISLPSGNVPAQKHPPSVPQRQPTPGISPEYGPETRGHHPCPSFSSLTQHCPAFQTEAPPLSRACPAPAPWNPPLHQGWGGRAANTPSHRAGTSHGAGPSAHSTPASWGPGGSDGIRPHPTPTVPAEQRPEHPPGTAPPSPYSNPPPPGSRTRASPPLR